ncbi:MAG: D-alanyl-D-alanine carboxypeptidase/D-alanyl-D-alanine-endopeptidase [Rhodobacteraceae bacterium]|nr:D-alanyl-D-alanine carboxypeptidase/D-alanyl-D-alanine-endopeptidase [Paracoccaceae bacterium]
MEDRTRAIGRRALLAGMLAGVAAPALARAPATSPRPRPRPAGGGAVVAGAPPAAAPATAAPPAAALVEAARLGGTVSFAVADAATGTLLEARDETLPMPPASVLKAITALYGLDRLGAGHRFPTRLVATGPIAGGRLEGDLVLVGGGDPELSTDDLGEMAAALRARGLRTLAGRFLYHAEALPAIDRIDPDQPVQAGYNPAISGLNLNFNRVHVEWRRAGSGWEVAVDARGERFRPAVGTAEMRVVSRAAPVFAYAEEGGRERWTVAAGALDAHGSRWLPVRRPALYAAEVFRTLARAQGISLPAAARTRGAVRGPVLVERPGDALASVLRDMLRYSTNLTAESVGLAASAAAGGPVTGLADSAARMAGWAQSGLGLLAPRLVDHSGLGGGSRISAADMLRVLLRAGPGGPLRGLMRRLEPGNGGGGDGRARPLEVVAKTGTLNFVSGLAGYARLAGGRDLAFAIFAADVARRDRLAMAERERPPGGAAWTARARTLQQDLIARWAAVHPA